MNVDNLVVVSIDDHVVEPADMFTRNASRFFSWDPFAVIPKEKATVGALRATATDVETAVVPRTEWTRRYAEKQTQSA